jgi:hypothetical protein
VRRVLALRLGREFIAPLASALGAGEGTAAHAAIILAVLAGFDMVRTVLGIQALDKPKARRLLIKLIEVCIDG